MASFWIESPTDKDGLLLKHQLLSPLFPLGVVARRSSWEIELVDDVPKQQQ